MSSADGVSNAAAADRVPPSKRAAAFGYIFAAAVIGYCSAAFATSFLTRVRNKSSLNQCVLASLIISVSFVQNGCLQLAVCIAVARMVCATCLLSESLDKSSRARERVCTIGSPLAAPAILFRSRLFMGLTALVALSNFATKGLGTIQFYFLNVSLSSLIYSLLFVLMLTSVDVDRWSSALTKTSSLA